jgi:AcrR family transcriptional regulator
MSPRAGLNRPAVLAAAAEMVDQEGLDHLTLAALADRLGVRSPSLYNHVGGLPDLLAALRRRGIRELGQALARAAVGKTGPDAVRAVAGAQRAFIHAHPGLYPLTVQSAHQANTPDPELEAASREVVEIVLAALAGYGFDQDESLHVVRGLRSLVHGFASLELAGGFGLPLEIDRSFEFIVQMFLDGLAARAEEPALLRETNRRGGLAAPA